ncbi:hypothetical protein LCGC14_2866390, partial [marine sediment metagenome]
CNYTFCTCPPSPRPSPKFHIGQLVRTAFGKDDHCGTVIEVESFGRSFTGPWWYYRVQMCPADKGEAISKKGVRHHAESLFEAASCCQGHCYV